MKDKLSGRLILGKSLQAFDTDDWIVFLLFILIFVKYVLFPFFCEVIAQST